MSISQFFINHLKLYFNAYGAVNYHVERVLSRLFKVKNQHTQDIKQPYESK